MRATRVAVALVVGLLATACGGDGGGATSTDSGGGTKQDVTISTTENAELGAILVDGEGRTLYRFDEDSASPPKATCDADCASDWPPVVVSGDIRVKGVDDSKVSSVKRSDGTQQVTVGGWPLYRYAEDAAPGEVKGQGVEGTWFASTPTGGKATEKGGSDDKGGDDGGGYDYGGY